MSKIFDVYRGQIAVALITALGVGLYFYTSGWTPPVAALAVLIVYFVVRWLIAWGYRVRYWYRRGTKGIYTTSCPDCGQYIYRRRQDWVLQCGRCGWKAGWPITRWITQSVPARQLRRTVVSPQLIVVVISIGVLVLGGVGGGITGLNSEGSTVNDSGDDSSTPGTAIQEKEDSTGNESDGASPISSEAVQEKYNRTLVEVHFIEVLNEERSFQGLQNVSRSAILSDMGEEHSADMAEHDYIGHDDSEGRTIQDRYEERGLLPECRLPIEGSDRYYPGAENAAGAWIEQQFTSTGGSYYVSDEQELAEGIFSIWMNSPPHRQAMLVYSAEQAGLGITITESGKVYAALELC